MNLSPANNNLLIVLFIVLDFKRNLTQRSSVFQLAQESLRILLNHKFEFLATAHYKYDQ